MICLNVFLFKSHWNLVLGVKLSDKSALDQEMKPKNDGLVLPTTCRTNLIMCEKMWHLLQITFQMDSYSPGAGTVMVSWVSGNSLPSMTRLNSSRVCAMCQSDRLRVVPTAVLLLQSQGLCLDGEKTGQSADCGLVLAYGDIELGQHWLR